MSKDINPQFRPKSYFRPERLDKFLLSKVKGAVLRRKLKALLGASPHIEWQAIIDDVSISDADRKFLETLHPMYMGGNYLPDAEEGEVEIARISIESTTFDVTSVYAHHHAGVIHYRVVDEYGGNTLQGPAEAQTSEPMTMVEFADYFLKAWPLHELLEMFFEDDPEAALDFFTAESEFYPDFDPFLRERVCEFLLKSP